MHRFFAKMPVWVRWLYPGYVWHIPGTGKTVYLTFDDGPHPVVTPFVLDQLARYGAKATFFCIGKNVMAHPEVYARVLAEGHGVGNHTQNHLNGWKTDTTTYLENIGVAAAQIRSALFRPPYGKIRRRQALQVAKAMNRADARIIMWDVLSADFDASLSPEQCLRRVLKNCTPGSVVVFHDSEKAFANLKQVLPEVLSALSAAGYQCAAIPGWS